MIEGIVLIIVMFVGAFVITGYAFLAKESRATFEELDIDGNGELTMNEITEHRMMDFNSADTDDDGNLSLEEMQANARAKADERVAKMFEKLDANTDGMLGEEELSKPDRA